LEKKVDACVLIKNGGKKKKTRENWGVAVRSGSCNRGCVVGNGKGKHSEKKKKLRNLAEDAVILVSGGSGGMNNWCTV